MFFINPYYRYPILFTVYTTINTNYTGITLRIKVPVRGTTILNS